MKKLLIIAATFLTLPLDAALASEACLYGKAIWASGSKIDGSTRISTSWNSKKAYPKNGKYELCLGSNPKAKITVYVQGDYYGKIYVNGDTQLHIVRD